MATPLTPVGISRQDTRQRKSGLTLWGAMTLAKNGMRNDSLGWYKKS